MSDIHLHKNTCTCNRYSTTEMQFTCGLYVFTNVHVHCVIMPRCTCFKVIWQSVHECVCVCISVCVSVYLYVCNSHFSKVAKSQTLANAVQAQCDNISNLIVLDFFNKGFIHYLWCDLLTSNTVVVLSRLSKDKSACNRFLSNLKLGSTQQLQLLTAKLRSKHAILAN